MEREEGEPCQHQSSLSAVKAPSRQQSSSQDNNDGKTTTSSPQPRRRLVRKKAFQLAFIAANAAIVTVNMLGSMGDMTRFLGGAAADDHGSSLKLSMLITSDSTNDDPSQSSVASSRNVTEEAYSDEKTTTTTTKRSGALALEKTTITSNVSDEGRAPTKSTEITANTINRMKVDGNNTVIVAVGDWRLRDIGVEWFRKLQQLGYQSPVVLSVGNATAVYYQERNVTHMPLIQCEATSWQSDNKPQVYRRRLFGSRWLVVHRLLKEGYNVLLSDADNLYQRYLPMQDLEQISNVDIFHAHGGGFPKRFEEQLGFTFCGGQGWYRASPAAIMLVEQILAKCRKSKCGILCDDQQVLNSLYAKDLDMQWDRSQLNLTDGFWKNVVKGYSPITGHTMQTWPMDVAYRGPSGGGGGGGGNDTTTLRCPNNPWVAMPAGNLMSSMREITMSGANFTPRKAPSHVTDEVVRSKWEVAAQWDDLCGSNRPLMV